MARCVICVSVPLDTGPARLDHGSMAELVDVGDTGRQHRASPRRAASAPCRIDDGDVVRFTRVVDLGMGGVRVSTAAPPPVGCRLELVFCLGASSPVVEAVGRVVWRACGYRGRGGLMGIEFASVSNLGEIIDYLKQA